MRRLLRVLLLLLAGLLLAAVAGAVWGRVRLGASLPQLDGERRIPGLAAPVHVTRDALGIPAVRAANPLDAARVTGFLHAQDRFFQMDLSRRRPAGELAALVGPAAVRADRELRLHRFRAQARRALGLLRPADREVLEAYAAGVNAGLQSLGAPPFEYLLLQQAPEPWRPEDTLLVVLAMFVTLQDDDGSYEAALGTMRDILPPEMFAFLDPAGSDWDAPLVGPAFTVPPIPGPDVYDLRARRAGRPAPAPRLPVDESTSAALGAGRWQWLLPDADREAAAVGSNSFAVAGRLTTSGRALLANDMHLTIRVPNIWYRASLEWPHPSSPEEVVRLNGVMLPGVPALVAGSNSYVAWGFTNTYADWSDIVLLDVDAARPGQYLTPEGWRAFDRFEETIEIAGESPLRQTVLWTIWGPVLEPDYRGRPRAYRWAAHSADQLAVSVRPLELVRTIEDAFDAANGLGVPGQNFVVADRSGRIGWSIYGSIPRRVGLDGRTPGSWSDGTRRWDGWLTVAEYPRIVDPEDGRLWTANARVVNGGMLAALGDGNYDIGARARIIRDRLHARERFGVGELLDIQLDTRAEFLTRWRTLLLQTLTETAVAGRSARAVLRDVVEADWSGRAAPDSAAYRLVRVFRESVLRQVTSFVLSECYEADPLFNYNSRRREAAVWQLLVEQPVHLLDPRYDTWTELLLASVDDAIAQSLGGGGDLRDRVWSEYNVVAYRHPLSGAVPILGRWLDMPSAALPGDLYTPRVHWGAVAASVRMIVSPGDEANGMMHMPTGQSGHPLSPFYGNSHRAWAAGQPSPFLPGAPVHALTLTP